MYLAAIDLGSNSFYLVIARCNGPGQFEIVERCKERVQLREGLLQNGALSPAAQERALACFKKFRALLDRYSIHSARAVGTYTLRAAYNAEAFIQQSSEVLGIPIEIISGEEEARLIYLGAMSKGIIHPPHLVLDIGGGSTELILGEAGQMKECISLTLGCLEYQLRFFSQGVMLAEHFEQGIHAAKQVIQPVAQRFHAQHFSRCLGGSGTLRELIGMLNGDAGKCQPMTLQDLHSIQHQLIQFKEVGNMKIEGVREDRHNVIAGGLCVLIALFEVLGIHTIELSQGAIREGVLFELSKLTF